MCVGGGVVDGLFDSTDIEPRVRFGALFGVSADGVNDFRSISIAFKLEITFDVGIGFGVAGAAATAADDFADTPGTPIGVVSLPTVALGFWLLSRDAANLVAIVVLLVPCDCGVAATKSRIIDTNSIK